MQKTASGNKINAYILLVVGIVALSLSSILVKIINASGPIIAFYRMLFSGIILTPFFVSKGDKGTSFENQNTFRNKLYIYPILSGITNSLDYSFTMIGIKNTSVASATLLNNIAPLWVGLISYFLLRDRFGKKYWIGMVLALFGSVIVIGNDFIFHPHFGYGDVFALISSIFYACYFIITEKGRKYFSPIKYYTLTIYSSAVCLFIINILLRNPFTGYSINTWVLFLASAIICQLIGQFSITTTLGCISANLVSTTLVFQPILSAFLAVPLLNERFSFFQTMGGAISLLGVYMVNRTRQ